MKPRPFDYVRPDTIDEAIALLAECGTYLSSEGVEEFVEPGTDLRELLPKIKRCTACALGSVFLSYVRLEDKVKVDQYDVKVGDGMGLHANSVSMRDTLQAAFYREDLCQMENAFERGGSLGDDEDFGLRSYTFGMKHAKTPERLKAIMRNVISNKGRFVPPMLSKAQKMKAEAGTL